MVKFLYQAMRLRMKYIMAWHDIANLAWRAPTGELCMSVTPSPTFITSLPCSDVKADTWEPKWHQYYYCTSLLDFGYSWPLLQGARHGHVTADLSFLTSRKQTILGVVRVEEAPLAYQLTRYCPEHSNCYTEPKSNTDNIEHFVEAGRQCDTSHVKMLSSCPFIDTCSSHCWAACKLLWF